MLQRSLAHMVSGRSVDKNNDVPLNPCLVCFRSRCRRTGQPTHFTVQKNKKSTCLDRSPRRILDLLSQQHTSKADNPLQVSGFSGLSGPIGSPAATSNCSRGNSSRSSSCCSLPSTKSHRRDTLSFRHHLAGSRPDGTHSESFSDTPTHLSPLQCDLCTPHTRAIGPCSPRPTGARCFSSQVCPRNHQWQCALVTVLRELHPDISGHLTWHGVGQQGILSCVSISLHP